MIFKGKIILGIDREQVEIIGGRSVKFFLFGENYGTI